MKYIETQLLLVLFWQVGDPTFVAPVRPRLKAMMGTPPERKAFQNFRKREGSEKISGRETSARATDARRDLGGIKRELVYLRVLYLFQSLVHDCKASRGWMAMQWCRKMDQQTSGFRSANPTKERPRNEFASSCFWRMPFSLHKTHFQIMPRNGQGTPRNVLP